MLYKLEFGGVDMELLREWLVWGESDLFFYGIGLIVISAFLPWKANKSLKNYLIIAACIIVYGICELVVTFWFQNWLRGYICLFVGGTTLSIAIGRFIKMIWKKLFRKER